MAVVGSVRGWEGVVPQSSTTEKTVRMMLSVVKVGLETRRHQQNNNSTMQSIKSVRCSLNIYPGLN